jgi:hypothetical protein
MTDFQDMMEIPYFREMVNTPSTHVYLWKNSVDVLHGGKHLTYGGVSANLIECPRCTDGYWWNHAQGMKRCSTDGCHTFIESNPISAQKLKEDYVENMRSHVDTILTRANLNIPPTLQENIGDKRVSEIDDIDDFNFDDDSDIDDWDWEDDF